MEHTNYELGILLFHLLSDTDYSADLNKDYDVKGNITTLLDSLKVDVKDLKEGFVAECYNFGINKEESIELFYKAVEYIR